MTVREVLNLMDHEVWVRVRVNDGREKDPANDLVLWSADWIGGGTDGLFVPKGLADVLDWDADDVSIECHPTGRQKPTPMIVVNAYNDLSGKPECGFRDTDRTFVVTTGVQEAQP